MFKCPYCGVVMTSEKIFYLHKQECDERPRPVVIKEPKDGFESMEFNELKKLATEKGLKYFRDTKKKELIEMLKRGVGNNDIRRY